MEKKYLCSVCDIHLDDFLPLSDWYLDNFKKYNWEHSLDELETLNYSHYSCPNCQSSDRERLYAIFLSDYIEKSTQHSLSILDFAPSRQFIHFMNNIGKKYSKSIIYRTADLYSEDVDDKIDISNMSLYGDNKFDLIICSHILEHVEDDSKALKELLRVLKPEGKAVLMVPILLSINDIDEDPAEKNECERWRRFGQNDHVRQYSKNGFIERIKNAGFLLSELGVNSFGNSLFKQGGITKQSVLYIAEKPKNNEYLNSISQKKLFEQLPLVSVLIPSYNHENFIAEAIHSVLNQTYQNFEIIITDDCSNDKSLNEIKKIKDDRITLIEFTENRGAAESVRSCFENAKGEYITILDSDNVFTNDKIEKQLKFLIENPNIGAVFSYAKLIDEDGEDFRDINHPYTKIFIKQNRDKFAWLNQFFYGGNCLCHSSILIRKKCYDEVGLYDSRLVQLPDFDLWIRLCMKYEIYILPEQLVKFRIRNNELNASGRKRDSLVRYQFEYVHILSNYLKIDNPDMLKRIFPECSLQENHKDIIQLTILKLAANFQSPIHNQFAADQLFNLLKGQNVKEYLKTSNVFSYEDYLNITGKYGFADLLMESETYIKSIAAEPLSGFYPDENGQRWMSEKGQIIVRPTSRNMLFNFILTCSTAEHYNRFPFTVNLCDGAEIVDQLLFKETCEAKFISLKIPVSETNIIIDLVSEDYFVPFQKGINEDTRKLSVKLSDIELIPDVFSEYQTAVEDEVENNKIFEQPFLTKKENYFPTSSEKKINLVASLIKQADHLFHINNLNSAEFLLHKALTLVKNNPELEKLALFELESDKTLERFSYNVNSSIDAYEEWLLINAMSKEEFNELKLDCKQFNYQPLVSIVTPVYNVDPKWLFSCVGSVLSQIYENWEFCLVDDGSTNKETLDALKQIQKLDSRIKVKFEKINKGISAATNIALSLANGEFIALLDNDDEITIDALFEIVKLLNEYKEADFIYSDEDKLDINGKRCEPFFKPDWSLELFRSYSYTCHLSVFRKSLIEEIGGFRDEFSGAQDYDITLRAIERTKNIFHLPKILYHWRKITGSAADVIDAKGWALIAAKKALEDHLVRIGLEAEVKKSESIPGCFRVKYKINEKPLVSILLPTRGQMQGKVDDELLFKCIQSIISKTEYSNYEILIGYNNFLDLEIENFLKSYPHRAINYKLNGEFNFANKINFIAKHAGGEQLVIFNDDLEVISGEWLSSLLEFSQQEEVGVVGSKLLFPDGKLQHVGMVLGINGYPAHVYHSAKPDFPGYRGDANLIRNYSAVTGAAMMVKKKLFDELNGLDENFRIDYNDTDFCMRVMEKGYRNVYTPYSLFYHHESAVLSSGRLNKKETELFQRKWKKYLNNDPFYNPNLTKKALDYSLDLCPI
jgi:O-antigen biosynthesis protein